MTDNVINLPVEHQWKALLRQSKRIRERSMELIEEYEKNIESVTGVSHLYFGEPDNSDR